MSDPTPDPLDADPKWRWDPALRALVYAVGTPSPQAVDWAINGQRYKAERAAERRKHELVTERE